MRTFRLALLLATGIALAASIGLARPASDAGPYKVLKMAKVGGEGGFDYIFADVAARRGMLRKSDIVMVFIFSLKYCTVNM